LKEAVVELNLRPLITVMDRHNVKFVPTLNIFPRHEDVGVSGGIASRIPNFGARRRWVVNCTPRPLYPQGKSSFGY